ncbi:MAG: hypothetical protein ACEPOZ_17240 [Marinifilaceae bacterium]
MNLENEIIPVSRKQESRRENLDIQTEEEKKYRIPELAIKLVTETAEKRKVEKDPTSKTKGENALLAPTENQNSIKTTGATGIETMIPEVENDQEIHLTKNLVLLREKNLPSKKEILTVKLYAKVITAKRNNLSTI